MEITVKEAKKLTSGTNKYGPWSLYKIEAADGKIYTTLADGADKLTPGTVFEPAEVMLGEEKDGVQEFKFKKFTLVTSGEPAPPVPRPKPNGKPDMSKEDWAEKDRLERWSRECNTCFMGIAELLKLGFIDGDRQKEVSEAALDWAMAHFTTTTPKTAPTRVELKKAIEKTEADADFDKLTSGSEALEFKDAAEFAARVKKNLDIYPSGICKKMGVDKIEEIADYQAAYELLKESADK